MDKINTGFPNIKIVYVDDHLDESISAYFAEHYCKVPFCDEQTSEVIKKEYDEVPFEENDTYEKLLLNPEVRLANIIIIDNYLFEENKARNKFTGKQFKLILQEVFPFIQTIIITQDQNLKGHNVVHKYNGENSKLAPNEFYNKEFEPRLKNAISDILEFRRASRELTQGEDSFKGSFLAERINNSLTGEIDYEELTKKDIDELITTFKELKEYVCNRN